MAHPHSHIDILTEQRDDKPLDAAAQEHIRAAADHVEKTIDVKEDKATLRRLRAGVDRLQKRTDLEANTKAAVEKLHAKLGTLAIPPQAFENETAQKAYDLAHGATNSVGGSAVKSWQTFTENNPKTGLALGMATLAAAGYGIYRAGKWTLGKIGDGLSLAWKNKWKILTLGLVGAGGVYLGSQLQSKAEAAEKPNPGAAASPDKPAEDAAATSLLNQKRQIPIDGALHDVSVTPSGEITIDGKRWKLQGKGIISLATFTFERADFQNDGSVRLLVKGAALGQEQKVAKTLPADKTKELAAHLTSKITPFPIEAEEYKLEMKYLG